MIYKDLDYKNTAVKELLEKTTKIFKYLKDDSIIFKAPTGAGKTIIMAEFLLQFVSEKKYYN